MCILKLRVIDAEKCCLRQVHKSLSETTEEEEKIRKKEEEEEEFLSCIVQNCFVLISYHLLCKCLKGSLTVFQAVISPELLNYFEIIGYEKSCLNLNIIYRPIFPVLSGTH